ncbi:MAG: hypothetical protein H0V07_10075, partial [Propionibacteriales bacterium]|nr:hypothetical protein [Propionibacteriales bacterium]
MLRKTIPIVATLALAAGGTLMAGAPAQAGPTAGALAAKAPATTNYGFAGQAYGTKVRGGSLPANSGRTAVAVLGCTRRTGVSDANSLARVGLGQGLGTVHGI